MFKKTIQLASRRMPSLLAETIIGFKKVFEYKHDAMGRPVLVIPGFMTNDDSTVFLRSALSYSGFVPHTWDQGTNIIASNDLINQLGEILKKLYSKHSNEPVTVIGWSMGGFYARLLAHQFPNLVNSVITLGTPFKRNIDLKAMEIQYNKIGINVSDFPIEQNHLDLMKIKPPVPFTSIYSKYDLISPEYECLENESEISENIEVETSHFGMVFDYRALNIIIDRCLQEKKTWKKYEVN